MRALIELLQVCFFLIFLLITPKVRVQEVIDSVANENKEEAQIRDITVITEKIDETYYAWAEGQFIGQAESQRNLAKMLIDKFGNQNFVFPQMKITTTKDKEVSSYGIEKTIH